MAEAGEAEGVGRPRQTPQWREINRSFFYTPMGYILVIKVFRINETV